MMTPVHVVTGFLGSGKTTLVAALLRDPSFKDTAVIINEFGEIGLDHLLVEAIDQEVVLLPQGCVCCSLNGTLSATLEGLDARRIAGTVPDFRRVVVETSGLSDPLPVLRTVLDTAMLIRGYGLGRVVTTVDALSGLATLARHVEAARQVVVADDVLITKGDLAPDVRALEDTLRGLNPHASVRCTVHGRISPEELLSGVPAPRPKPGRASRFVAEGGQDHGIKSLSLRPPAPVAFEGLAAWLGGLVDAYGHRLLRVKGLVAIAGQDRPLVVQGAQHVFHPPKLLAGWPGGLASSVLVFILDGVEPETIRQSALDHCILQAAPT